MREGEKQTDVAIVGAGPVGLFAVFQCGMPGLRCHLFDAPGEPGGQCTALHPEKPICDIPGHPRIAAGDLVDRLNEQAAPFAPVHHLGGPVARLDPAEGGLRIESAAGARVAARAIHPLVHPGEAPHFEYSTMKGVPGR